MLINDTSTSNTVILSNQKFVKKMNEDGEMVFSELVETENSDDSEKKLLQEG